MSAEPIGLRGTTEALARGSVTARELVQHAWETVTAGAVERSLDEAAAAAEASDRRRAAGKPLGPLDGMPLAVKANIDVAGVPTSNGTGLTTPVAATDATVVRVLRGAGMIPVVTATLAEAAVGAVTDNAFTGPCPNPRHPTLQAGGSSGGSAALVASGAVPAALGSDTMGSVRIPAAYCGVSGFKPSTGAIDTAGLVPLGDGLDTVGLLADRPADLVLLAAQVLRSPRESVELRGLHVMVPTLVERADDVARRLVDDAVGALEQEGARVERDVELGIDPARVRRLGLVLCELGLADLYEDQFATQDPGLSPGLGRFIEYGLGVRSNPEKVGETRAELEEIAATARDALSRSHAMLLPVTPGPTPSLGEDPVEAADLTAWVNVAGLPAVTIPTADDDADHVGRGLQVIGGHAADRRVLEIACLLDEVSR